MGKETGIESSLSVVAKNPNQAHQRNLPVVTFLQNNIMLLFAYFPDTFKVKRPVSGATNMFHLLSEI